MGSSNILIDVLQEIGPLMPIISSITFASVCAAFGYKWNDKLNEQTRYDLSNWLHKPLFCGAPKSNIAALFLPFFDRVFKTDRMQRPGILRSLVASTLALATVVVVWTLRLVGGEHSLDTVIYEFYRPVTFVILLPFLFCMNVISDYFSLWETRLVLGHMARVSRRLQVAMYLLIDLLSSLVIYGLGLFLATGSILLFFGFIGMEMNNLFAAWWGIFSALIRDRGWMLCGMEPGDIYGVFLYTTLLTSIWIWVFVLGTMLWTLLRRVGGWLDPDRHPFGVVMTLGGLAFGCSIMAISYVLRLLGSSGC